MKRTALIALVIVAGLGMQGCAAATGQEAPASDDTATASTPAPAASTPVPSATTDDARADADPLTPIHEDAHTSVFLADAAQISAIADIDVTPDTVDSVVSSLKREDAWASQPATKDYASLIAEAVARESHDATRAVKAVAHDDDARVKIVVLHTDHKNMAHIERGHAD